MKFFSEFWKGRRRSSEEGRGARAANTAVRNRPRLHLGRSSLSSRDTAARSCFQVNETDHNPRTPRMRRSVTAECYGLHCLFKSMLGGLWSLTKEACVGSKASEAKTAKKVLKTQLSF